MGKEVDRFGHGVFGWDGAERRSGRYGAFTLSERPYDGGPVAAAHLDLVALRALVGKRVHVWCQAVAIRESGHCGDLFHRIKPKTPKVGETIDLGVGTLGIDSNEWPEGVVTTVVLKPGDGRDHFWIDPRKLYNLHDQTVDLFVEETVDDFTTASKFKIANGPESIDVGDGTLQTRGVENGTVYSIEPNIEKLGDGLFALSIEPEEKGRRRKLVPRT